MADGDLTQVSAESNGRILTGVGVTTEDLAKTMARHEPAPGPSADGAPDQPPVTAPSASGEQKQPRGAKRFDQLTGEREAAKREAEAARKELEAFKTRAETAERERDRLKDELDTAQRAAPAHRGNAGGPTRTENNQAGPEAVQAVQPTRPKPTVDQIGTTYQTYEDFLEDLADWKSEQRLAQFDLDARIRQSLEADRASRTLQDKTAAARQRGQKAYPDFEAVITASHMMQPWPMEKIHAIANLETPEVVQYALGKDPKLAESLRMETDPVQFGMALARLVTSAAPVASPASTEVPRSVAPAPYVPVGAGSSTATVKSSDLAKKGGHDFDASGYREKRAAERGIRGVR